jgi:hypothetical protein
MADWVAALMSAGVGFSAAVLVREWLIVRVSIWSLTADEKGREHALRLLRSLKPGFRREQPPPVEGAVDGARGSPEIRP